MSKEQIFSKSLQAHKDYVNSLTNEQLEEEMKFFDNYEIEQFDIYGVVGRSEQLFCTNCKSTHVYQPEPESIKCYSCGFYGAK